MSDPSDLAIVRLDAEGFARHRAALAKILVDCVAGNASIGFVWPFERADALVYWDGLVEPVASGAVRLFGAFQNDALVGTVQLHIAGKANQPHRAEVAKVLVPRQYRRSGIGRALMLAAEDEARQLGRWHLLLDTARGGGAESLYENLGWIPFGTCPDYALNPDGTFIDTVYYWKRLTL